MTDQGAPDNNDKQEWEEVWLLFGQEGKEALDLVEEMLIQAEADSYTLGQIAELFRAMHNFKGMARMMGLSVTEALAHRAEDIIGLARDNGVMLNSQMISLLLEVLDRLRLILDEVLLNRRDVDTAATTELIGRLEELYACHAGEVSRLPEVKAGPPADASPPDTLEFLPALPAELVPALDEELLTPAADAQVSLPAPEPAPAKPQEVVPIESIDPAADPAFVQIYLNLAGEELGRLHTGLNILAGGDTAGRQEIEAALDNLTHATNQMGYGRVAAILETISTAAAEPAGEARTVRLQQAELKLFEELAVVEEQAQVQHLIERGMGPDITWLFRHWYAERIFINLAALSEVMDDLEGTTGQMLAQGAALAWNETRVNRAAYLLRTLYHGCLFFNLEEGGHLTLVLEDLYARVGQWELPPNDLLLSLTRSYVTHLGSAIQVVDEGDTPNFDHLEALLEQAEKILYTTGTNWVSQMTRDILDRLALPPEFEAVITPESLLITRKALASGARFYTLLANLDEDEGVGLAFYEWTQSGAVNLITNATVYQGERSFFNFLLASTVSPEEVATAVARIDPQGRYLSLAECKIVAESLPLNGAGGESMPPPAAPPLPQPAAAPDMMTGQALDSLMSTVGELVATHSSLRNTVDKLQAVDLMETVAGLMKQAGENWTQAQQQLETALKPWLDHQRALAQIETELSTALNRLHQTTLALRVRPAAEILTPLPFLAQEMAARQGKQVEVEVKGTEIELDRTVFNLLANAAQRLVSFTVAASLETPAQRQARRKPGRGRISVELKKQDDHIRLFVSDDGDGLDRAAVLQRGRELGWPVDGEAAEEELARWVLRDGFRGQGSDPVDLAALRAELQARRGQLTLTSRPGAGLNFELYLPLESVVIDSMVVRAGNVRYVVPVNSIRRIVKPAAQAVIRTSAEGCESLLRLEETLIPIQSLSGNGPVEPLTDQLLLVVERNHQPAALIVDELIGQQQVLVRPVQGYLAQIPTVSGCAVLGEGDIGLVLNLQ